MLGGEGEMQPPLRETSPEVRQLPEGPTLVARRSSSGVQASRELADGMAKPPPAMRRAGVRGVLDVPSLTGQVGRPAPMDTEA